MILKVKKLSENAKLPTRATSLDVGYDLYSAEDKEIFAHSSAVVKTDIAVEPPTGYWLQIETRSGHASKNYAVLGGIIDPAYRGPIGVVFSNNNTGLSFKINKGDKIAQMVLRQAIYADIEEVVELSETDRGENGFGSSGNK